MLDLKGKILAIEQLEPESLSPEVLLPAAAMSLRKMFSSLSVKQEHVIGVGVAASGICHPADGVVIRSINLGWADVPVAEILGKDLGLPVLLENDANACALAELWLGNARETLNSMYIKTEAGVGVGIISDQKLLTGSRFVTGEIGHIPLIPGKPCRCGQLAAWKHMSTLRLYRKLSGSNGADSYLESLSNLSRHMMGLRLMLCGMQPRPWLWPVHTGALCLMQKSSPSAAFGENCRRRSWTIASITMTLS